MRRTRIRLFRYELESMPKYETSIPTGKVLWKMWRSAVKGSQFMGWPKPSPCDLVSQYVPHRNPKLIGIRTFEIDVLEGPMPRGWEPPDWQNYARWKREFNTERKTG